MQNCLRNSYSLQHPLGKFPKLNSLGLNQSDLFQNFFNPCLAFRTGQTGELSVVVEKFVGSEIVVKVWLFRQKSDLRLDLGIGPVFSQDSSSAPRREDQSHQNLQRRGFARSIRTQEAE